MRNIFSLAKVKNIGKKLEMSCRGRGENKPCHKSGVCMKNNECCSGYYCDQQFGRCQAGKPIY